ncbi:MAG: hypothetical protein IAE80_01840 [Anaerolinea sp.]|nr:hypothetical protein [Anaerolinea sp.]
MQWLRDTWNGLVVVLLKPYLPRWATILALLLGIGIGFLGAYVLFPTQYYDGDVLTLEQSWQDEWVKLLADRNAAANADVSANIIELLSQIDDPLSVINRLLNDPTEQENYGKLQAILPYAQVAQETAPPVAPVQPNTTDNLLPFIVVPLVSVIVVFVVIILYGMFIYPNLIEPLQRRGQKPDPTVAAERANREEAKKVFETQKTDFAATTNLGTPIMQRMSTYTAGFGQYDDSFTIEDAEERFLGECGAGIAETTADGKATAVEVWLFDKDDFVRTMTKVFVSEGAMTDPAVRSRLQEKGDLILAQTGAILTLETAALRLQARIIDLQYAPGSNAAIQKLTLELAAWTRPKSSVPAAAPVIQTAPPLPAAQPTQPYAPQYAPPPPTQPSQPAVPPSFTPAGYGNPSSAPSLRPAQPASPPPPQPRSSPDDDPFGGTGDFTPIT